MSKTKRIKISGDGHPVILVHGSLGNKSQWKTFVEALSLTYTTICIDLCGYGTDVGSSYKPNHGLTDEVIFLRSAIWEGLEREVPTEGLCFVAHSFGASVALKYASMYPTEVNSLVLYEPVSIHLLEKDDEFHEIAQSAEIIISSLNSGDSKGAAKAFVEYWGGNGYWNGISEFQRFMLCRAVGKVGQDYHSILSDPLSSDDLSIISSRMLLIHGAECKRPVKRICDTLRMRISNLCCLVVNDGHFGFVDNQDLYIDEVEKFLRIHTE